MPRIMTIPVGVARSVVQSVWCADERAKHAAGRELNGQAETVEEKSA